MSQPDNVGHFQLLQSEGPACTIVNVYSYTVLSNYGMRIFPLCEGTAGELITLVPPPA